MGAATPNRLVPISEKVWANFSKRPPSVTTSSPPVGLEGYAKEFGVERVLFRELISDAGLAKLGDGFEIVVNTEAPGVFQPPETIASTSDGGWKEFQSSLRFTVAHEIAHAAFIRAAKERNEDGLLESQRSDVEEACKILARLMLLPCELVKREAAEHLLDPDHISILIRTFRVSPEVFLRRLHLSDWNREKWQFDGFLAFVQEVENRLYLKAAYVVGRYATDRFHRAVQRLNSAASRKKYRFPGLSHVYRQSSWALEGLLLNDLRLDPKLDVEGLLRTTEGTSVNIETRWDENSVIPCNLAFQRIRQAPLGILLSVKIIGPIQKPVQKTLL